MTGMINWYRATLRSLGRSEGIRRIHVPSLIVWGKQDPHISYEMAQLSVDRCQDGRLVTFDDASHWVLHDKPGEVSQLLIEHFSVGDSHSA
jgi:pimeloyl-ACP methyl ester carboxylesterase